MPYKIPKGVNQTDLQFTARGTLVPNVYNIHTMLRDADCWKDTFALGWQAEQIYLRRPIEGRPCGINHRSQAAIEHTIATGDHAAAWDAHAQIHSLQKQLADHQRNINAAADLLESGEGTGGAGPVVAAAQMCRATHDAVKSVEPDLDTSDTNAAVYALRAASRELHVDAESLAKRVTKLENLARHRTADAIANQKHDGLAWDLWEMHQNDFPKHWTTDHGYDFTASGLMADHTSLSDIEWVRAAIRDCKAMDDERQKQAKQRGKSRRRKELKQRMADVWKEAVQ